MLFLEQSKTVIEWNTFIYLFINIYLFSNCIPFYKELLTHFYTSSRASKQLFYKSKKKKKLCMAIILKISNFYDRVAQANALKKRLKCV